MKKVTDFIKSTYGFKLVGKGLARGETYQLQDYLLFVTSRWSGRYEEFLCFKFEKCGKEILSISYQVDTEGYMSKPKIYSADEINSSLAEKLKEVGF